MRRHPQRGDARHVSRFIALTVRCTISLHRDPAPAFAIALSARLHCCRRVAGLLDSKCSRSFRASLSRVGVSGNSDSISRIASVVCRWLLRRPDWLGALRGRRRRQIGALKMIDKRPLRRLAVFEKLDFHRHDVLIALNVDLGVERRIQQHRTNRCAEPRGSWWIQQ